MLFIGLIILIGLFILPPSLGEPKPFIDKKGNEIKNSIAEKKKLSVAGQSLGIHIRGKNKDKPVLLFLGGGPGIPQYILENMYPSGIEDGFIVCYLDYRGTASSYDSTQSAKSITTERYLIDVNKVTNYLRNRFKQEKFF